MKRLSLVRAAVLIVGLAGVMCSQAATPFWNGNSQWFIFAPAFDFPTTPQADRYRFTVLDDLQYEHTFEATSPKASLEPVWNDLPVGLFTCLCEGLDAKGNPVGLVAKRRGWKRASFKRDSYPPRARPYSEAAAKVYDYLFDLPQIRFFREHGSPDPSYRLNCYPSKMQAALIRAMVGYARLRPDRRDAALALARQAADYLLSISAPADAPTAHFPPTYETNPAFKHHTAKTYEVQTMLLYPASVGTAYLELAKATGAAKYRQAAIAIADTYLKLQGEDGTWPLKLYLKNGQPVSANRAFPVGIAELLESVSAETGDAKYRAAADRAMAYVERGPMVDFNWEGQFEDVRPTAKYVNLTKHPAAEACIYLMRRYPSDRNRLASCRATMRFCEDQFVLWERPCRTDGTGVRTGNPIYAANDRTCHYLKWTVFPSVTEQYFWNIPIDASSAKMIRAYLSLWRSGGDATDLAKAKALGDALTRAQLPNGRIPTHFDEGNLKDPQQDWLNCMISGAMALDELSAAERADQIKVDPAEKSSFQPSKLRFAGETDKSPVAYGVGETMRFTFTLDCHQDVPANKVFFVKWSRRGDDGVSFSGFQRIADGGKVVVETSIDRPGFVNVNAHLTDVQGNSFCYFQDDYNRIPLAWEGSAGAAVDEIRPSYEEPSDFDAFWMKWLGKLADVPVKAELADVPTDKLPSKYRNGSHVAQMFSVDCLPRPVTGFLVYPKDAKPQSLPVRITFDGYGTGGMGAGPAEWLFTPLPQPMVKMHVNAHGYKLLQPDEYYKALKLDGYGFACADNEKPETSYFLGMALRLVRAYDFAKTLPVWNGRDLIANGGSQGGFQSVLAGSLVKGLTEARPDVTWLCDCAGPKCGRLNGWRPDYRAGLAYFDSVFHARRIPPTCRLAIGRAGLGDYVCPPTGLAASYNAANCPKSICWWQNSTHLWVTPTSIRRCWTNEAPSGAAVKGVQNVSRTTRSLTGVKAAFDPNAWRIESDGRAARPFDFSKRCNLRQLAGNVKSETEVRVSGSLVAEQNGDVVLGAGMDWWWECFVNGKGVFGRTRVNGANNSSAFEPTDWTFAVPVKKGANAVQFKVVVGENGSAAVAVLDGPREIDPKAVKDYRKAVAGYRAPSSVPFSPVWEAPSVVRFETAQPYPAGIEYRKRGDKTWCQAWDVTMGTTRHVVRLPDPSLFGDFEYRKVEWARDESISLRRDEKDVRSTRLDYSKVDFDAVTEKNPLEYEVGEKMRFRYTLRLNQPDPVGHRHFLRWERFGDDGVLDAGVEELKDGKTVEVVTSIEHAGFVRVKADVVDASGRVMTWWNGKNERNESLHYLSAAAAGAKTLQPACEEPSDFCEFWAKQKAELKAVPVKFEMTELPTNQIPAKYRASHRTWAVRVDCSGPRPVTGYLTMPRGAKAKSLSACCGFTGYGCQPDTPPTEWQYERASESIYFHINAHGYDLQKDKQYYVDFAKKINAKGEYGLVNEENDKPETTYFRYMAHRVVRAFDFVKKLPEWNGRDLKACGGSQGGLQTTWAGVLVEGLTECEPWVTWCSDMNGAAVGRYIGWRPSYRPGLAYYDSVIHARHIPPTCRLNISRAGLGDTCCPPSGLACQYNAARCPKTITWVQSSDHGTKPKEAVRHDYVFSAPAGAGVTGTAKHPTKLRKGTFVKAVLKGIPASGNYRKDADGKLLPVKSVVTLEGTLQAEADGEAILGVGYDWWWTCKVNGKAAFGVSTLFPDGNGGTCSPSDWTFAVPVRKGANKIAFDIVLGQRGNGGAVVRDPADFPDGVDDLPAEHYRALIGRFPHTWDFGGGATFTFDGRWKCGE